LHEPCLPTGLPGAEDVNIPTYLSRVKEWAAFVRNRIPRFSQEFKLNAAEYHHSENFFNMFILVQVLKLEIGIRYNPERIGPSEANACLSYPDSRDLLINGPLGPTRQGTCNNIPMAVVAVARELGYPVYLSKTLIHVFAKWVGPNGYTFNIEASNPAGMVSHPDEYYRDTPEPIPEAFLRSGCYLRPLTATEELAFCMMSRGWVRTPIDGYDRALYVAFHEGNREY
jgi:hypothetical protein